MKNIDTPGNLVPSCTYLPCSICTVEFIAHAPTKAQIGSIRYIFFYTNICTRMICKMPKAFTKNISKTSIQCSVCVRIVIEAYFPLFGITVPYYYRICESQKAYNVILKIPWPSIIYIKW